MREAVIEYWTGDGRPSPDNVRDPEWLMAQTGKATAGEALAHLFEIHAEKKLIPTPSHLPVPKVSPLANTSPDDPAMVDRFEIIIAGMKVAMHTELNNPIEQCRRFDGQLTMQERGDDEAPDG